MQESLEIICYGSQYAPAKGSCSRAQHFYNNKLTKQIGEINERSIADI